jgi:hypothetical protein
LDRGRQGLVKETGAPHAANTSPPGAVSMPRQPASFTILDTQNRRSGNMKSPKTTLAITCILILSASFRLYLINKGGWNFFPDEKRFMNAIDLVNRSVGLSESLKNLFTYGIEHKLFMFISALYIYLYNILSGSSFNPVYFFGIFSVINIYLVYKISANLGADGNESLASAFFMACASTNAYWSRHLVPYDISLCLGLCAILLATAQVSRHNAVICGFLASCGFFTYYGSWMISSIGPLLFVYFTWKSKSPHVLAKITLLTTGFLLPFLIMWSGVAYYSNNYHYNMISDFIYFSKSINQGEFASGYAFPLRYFFAAEELLSVLWIIAISLTIYHLLTKKSATDNNRIYIYLLSLIYIYSLLTLFSTVLHRQVVYGRTARQMLPFISLLSGFAINHYFINRKTSRLLISCVVILACSFYGLKQTASYLSDSEMVKTAYLMSKTFGPKDKIYIVKHNTFQLFKFDENLCSTPKLISTSASQNSFSPYMFDNGKSNEWRYADSHLDSLEIYEAACPFTEDVVRSYFKLMGEYNANIKNLVLDNARERIKNLQDIVSALYSYANDHDAYPVSLSFSGVYLTPTSFYDNWIADLVPTYIGALPHDPRDDKDPRHQYVYASDGKDFKIIAHLPEDCRSVKSAYPQLVDPARLPCGAYGYWTPGAKDW